MSARSDCRKFAPNIFNKSKCTNCFRQKEEHSAEALECNRASRKVSNCGYLFVAPGWDFSNPVNRTKRWQRRWFVLYDDGELTYSLDENPDTVPQACVDMTLVLEVRDADEVTGHPFSLAVTSPDRVTFVKGACREEARWWSEVLSVYPRNKGRHKRNATFPGGQPGSLLQNGTTIRNGTGNLSRPRHNSCHAGGWPAPPRPVLEAPGSVPVSAPMVSIPPPSTPPVPTPEPKVYTDQPVSSASPPTRDKINSEDKARSRRGAARARRTPAWGGPADPQEEAAESAQHRILLEEYESESKREEKLKDIALSLTRPRERGAPSPPAPDPPTREAAPAEVPDGNMPDKYVRGDPDGCVRGAAARVELPAEGLLNMRKGWLLRQAGTGATPARHWFVLRGAALLYYRDPSAEVCGIMDGVIDLNGVAAITEIPPTKTYGFMIKTWDNRLYTLSALTAGIRANWMSAIRRTAGLPDPLIDCSDKMFPEKHNITLDRQDSIENNESPLIPSAPVTPITPMTPRSIMFSSDEEYRTASEGGRRDSVDWGDTVTQLPPSPILNRNPISRVKDKVRSRNIQHNSSIPSSPQSDDTTPSDLDETDNLQDRSFREIIDPYAPIVIDKIRKEDIIKPLKTSYISTIDKQAIEIEDLRKKLKMAQHDVITAEKELKRLRQIKSESVLREKKIDELLATLQHTEDELNRRTKEAENLETLKKMYNEDKSLWETKLTETEAFLRESTEHCELLNRQLENGQTTIEQLQSELSQLNDRLTRGAEENEVLYMKLRDIEGRASSLSIVRGKGRSVESLSELANIDLEQELESMNKDRIIEEYDELRCRFEKAIQEIRAMKRELRESHNLYDELELTNHSLLRDIQIREENNQSQISMMAARIQDLTLKLSTSDKQVRALKHKLQKSESRDKRRSLSLKGKDSFSIGKEVEEKLAELENKINILEGGNVPSNSTPVIQPPSKPPSPTKEKSPSAEKELDSKSLKRLSARLRRKSLDSATSSEPMKMLIRLSSLETKVGNALESKKNFAVSCESLNHLVNDTTSADSSESHSCSPNRHLLDRLQSLENVVISSRNKVNECICQVSAIRSSRNRRSPSPILDKTYSMKSIERCLTDVSKKLQDCTDKCVLPFESIYEGSVVNDSVINIVHQLELQLRSKLLEINKKKCTLLQSGELNQRRNLEFLAEKLAYEAVLISRINDAVTDVNGEGLFKRLIKSEVEETSQLVTSLQSKLNGSHGKRQSMCKTSMDYLAKILSRKINILNNGSIDKGISQSQSTIKNKELELLKALQKELTQSVNQFKSEKMIELTKALIIEALNCQAESDFDQQGNIDNIRIQEAWNQAQDIVNNELINSEISHVMTRCAQYYATQLEAEKSARFTLVASQQAVLEKWFQVAHEQLSVEMKTAIADITSHYQECLNSVRLRSPINEDKSAVDSRQLLYQLADVIAHKVLIDAKIYVCSGGFDNSSVAHDPISNGLGMEEESVWNKLIESDNVVASLDSDPTQEAEFIYLFQHFSNECRALFSDEYADNKEDLIKIGDALRQVELVVKHLHLQIGNDIGNKENVSSESKGITQVQGVLDLCESLKRSVEALSSHIPCQHCLRLQSAINRLKTEHDETLDVLKIEQDKGTENKRSLELVRGRARTAEELVSSLQQQHKSAQKRAQKSEAEVKQLKQQITDHQSECQHLKVQHEQEQAQLKERARRLERRLGTLDSEYSQQLEQLRSAYHKSLNADLQGDSICQRYQVEIEQLRVLCEKGLLAMESSHRRIIQELEDKHRTEREQLRVEKEQALAEETQATLAALDAMRKAHESEVQREVSKFKREFATRTQQGVDIQLHTRHHIFCGREEMEEIKQEILSLSEKYSSKCVESAALEEKLCNVSQQLAQAQQHIMQLDARNKQLRAHLMSEMNEMSNSEIVNGNLRDSSSPHGQGSAGLSDQSTPLWDHLRHLASVWQSALAAESNKNQSVDTGARQICGSKNQNTVRKDRKYKKPQAVTSTELSGFPRVSRYPVPSMRASISPLAGIVAERKKRFEL